MAHQLGRLRELRHADSWIFGTMLFSACLSLTASFVLSVDAVRLAANPDTSLSCNINAVISCGTVASSWQAHLFGFPNAFLGLVAEPVVIIIAVASLGGMRFPRWFMFSAQVVYTLGVASPTACSTRRCSASVRCVPGACWSLRQRRLCSPP